MQAITIGLDIARSVLKVHGADEQGRSVLRKRTSRGEVLALFANRSCRMIGLEALAGARYWVRGFPGARKDPRLMPPSYVRTNRYDAADAEACAEAARLCQGAPRRWRRLGGAIRLVEAAGGVCSADGGPHIQNAG